MFDNRIESQIEMTAKIQCKEMSRFGIEEYYPELRAMFTKINGQTVNRIKSVIPLNRFKLVIRPYIFVEVSSNKSNAELDVGVELTKAGTYNGEHFNFKINVGNEFDPGHIVREIKTSFIRAKNKGAFYDERLEDLTNEYSNEVFKQYGLNINSRLVINNDGEIDSMKISISEAPEE